MIGTFTKLSLVERRVLARYALERRRKRKPRYAKKPRSLVVPEKMTLQNRPEEVNDRSHSATGKAI
ncbi:hypothetical protein SAMN04488527_12422 [Aliiroseovarius crassostreae]|uniref:Uncharacterized protein n=1 Tax=Aliiroseovarius crassostreae TaxID=154981 RepID=A0A0P7I1J8_9RHOB|nr:hypothetical protein [Aliiroseovarius crassostreae]KPN62773.1 hypothetical protein AKJ29_01105 [Aliiroseovarius crassostreae]SFU86334.1 hypothetical protein SAMN04488527_12422 [Aliiroseovarius crassostreae]